MERREVRDVPGASEWFERFRTRYDEVASDPVTSLGLFYERHRHFLVFVEPFKSDMVEYTNSEWTKIMVGFLSQLAVEFGFDQTITSDNQRHVAWLRPSLGWKRSVEIVQEDEATEQVLTTAIPNLVASDGDLRVLMMYPDYPMPSDAHDVDGATEVWRLRIEKVLARLRSTKPFLLLTIGANSWEIPSPWKAFAWSPADSRLQSLESRGKSTGESSSTSPTSGPRSDTHANRRTVSESRSHTDRVPDEIPREPARETDYEHL